VPGTPVPLASPYVWSSPDYAGLAITLTVTFDNTTLVIATVTVTVDAGCRYVSMYFGVGPDGVPDNTARKFLQNAGTVTIKGALLAQYGFALVTDILAGQITAGP
jgi:hypothetical protein